MRSITLINFWTQIDDINDSQFWNSRTFHMLRWRIVSKIILSTQYICGKEYSRSCFAYVKFTYISKHNSCSNILFLNMIFTYPLEGNTWCLSFCDIFVLFQLFTAISNSIWMWSTVIGKLFTRTTNWSNYFSIKCIFVHSELFSAWDLVTKSHF